MDHLMMPPIFTHFKMNNEYSPGVKEGVPREIYVSQNLICILKAPEIMKFQTFLNIESESVKSLPT